MKRSPRRGLNNFGSYLQPLPLIAKPVIELGPLGSIRGEIPDGYSGNLKTIEIMKLAAVSRGDHPLIRDTAVSVLNAYGVSPQNYGAEALAIGTYVQENVRYVHDPAFTETVIDPLTMIEQISRGIARGDCDDYSTLIAALLLSIGHTPAFRAVRYSNSYNNFDHIYVVDMLENGGEVVLDGIVADQPMGYEVPHASHKDFYVQ